jgi:hypothetical protein
MLIAEKGLRTSYRPPANLLARIASDRGVRTNTRTVIECETALGKAPAFLLLALLPSGNAS